MKWASGECKRQGLHDTGTNRRYVLGDALYQIRIPTMSMEAYSQVAVKSGVLTDSEQLAIFKHLASGSVEPVQNFVTKPRKGKQIYYNHRV
ncbi:hypothetical protein FSP39_013374 [Pinctada imbricata]|uniref:Uncharacterized protein n=1 Tax=Pinctada imbricata TaxID=66713 RepID=A0AA88YCX3_PINIB|nr:hypothetical protein FSP39_013374 [Pinctada imbricata]